MHPANNVTQVTIFANFNSPKNLKTFKSRKLRSRHKDKYDFLLFLLLFYKLDFWLVKLRNFNTLWLTSIFLYIMLNLERGRTSALSVTGMEDICLWDWW